MKQITTAHTTPNHQKNVKSDRFVEHLCLRVLPNMASKHQNGDLQLSVFKILADICAYAGVWRGWLPCCVVRCVVCCVVWWCCVLCRALCRLLCRVVVLCAVSCGGVVCCVVCYGVAVSCAVLLYGGVVCCGTVVCAVL